MSNHHHIDDDMLHAFIDGELDAEHVRIVEAKIMADPALAERVEAFRGDKEMLKRAYGPLIDSPLPAQWVSLTRKGVRPGRASFDWRLPASIAATILLIVAVAVGYLSRPAPAPRDIVQVALDARREVFPSEHTIQVRPGIKVAQLDDAVSGAVAMHVKAPDLVGMGYRLTAVRLYRGAPAGRSAELVYRNDQGRLFTLYVRRSDDAARFDQFRRGGVRVCVWQDGKMGMVMVGDVSADAMQRLASLSYTGLTL